LVDPSTFEKFGMREQIVDLSSERLDFLTKVFEIVCEIYSIPQGAQEEREALATQIILDNRTIADRGKLLEAARKAAESYLQKRKKPSLTLVSGTLSSHKKPTS
jgi:hypothetical protein